MLDEVVAGHGATHLGVRGTPSQVPGTDEQPVDHRNER
jgi:hypothetical protein